MNNQKSYLLIDASDVNHNVYPFTILTNSGYSPAEVEKVNAVYIDSNFSTLQIDRAEFFRRVAQISFDDKLKSESLLQSKLNDCIKAIETTYIPTKKKHKPNTGLSLGSYRYKSKGKNNNKRLTNF